MNVFQLTCNLSLNDVVSNFKLLKHHVGPHILLSCKKIIYYYVSAGSNYWSTS